MRIFWCLLGILFFLLAVCELTGKSLFRARLYDEDFTLRSVSRFIRMITYVELLLALAFLMEGLLSGLAVQVICILLFVSAAALLVAASFTLKKVAQD